jgi:quercetin dioxygenase-like cupin family protein
VRSRSGVSQVREERMKVSNLFDIRGTEFPAGRLTRVIVGPGAPLEARGFVMGYVTIYPGGSIPLHSHEQEEVYIIMAGEGIMKVDGLQEHVKKGSYVYIDPNSNHLLQNTSDENMVMIFCYAPKAIAEHWQQELEGKIR